MRPAERMERLPMYVFAALGARIRRLQGEGKDIIRLDIGSPDMPPPDALISTLCDSASLANHHGYAGYFGIPELRQAIADFYQSRYNVSLDSKSEVQPLIGSKEGIANMALAWLDPGDLALVPDPGYPTYRMGARMAGADTIAMPLLPENNFLPDLDAIPSSVARRARLMWLNYPNNPTGAVADLEFFQHLVDFASEHDILICHDAPYTDIFFDDFQPPSLLEVPGAHNVAVEFNSLSKTYNMAGWRVAMAVGNDMALSALLQIKSNIDSGIFRPIQDTAVAALSSDQGWLSERNQIYADRRNKIMQVLDEVGIKAETPSAGLYIWAEIPRGYTSREYTDKLLLEAGISLAPGTAFGECGEGYMRISLGQSYDRIEEAMDRLRSLDW